MLDDGASANAEKSAMATLTFGLLGGDVVRYYAIER